MKVAIFINTVFFLACLISLQGDEIWYESNTIFLVDEEIVVGDIADLKVYSGDDVFYCRYNPGRLQMLLSDSSTFNRLADTLKISFDYYKYNKRGKQRVYNYEIILNKCWLDEDYLIIKMYNLSKGKYNRLSHPLDDNKKYTFELYYPGGQMLRRKN